MIPDQTVYICIIPESTIPNPYRMFRHFSRNRLWAIAAGPGFFIGLFIPVTLHSSASHTSRIPAADFTVHQNDLFQQAARYGELTEEGYRRCEQYVRDWLKFADPITKLIPRNLEEDRDLWNAQDCAADNYPFMVLTSFFTNRERYEGLMKEMLRNEQKLTSRVGNLPDDFSVSGKKFVHDEVKMGRIVFGASEYAKDGLMPLTEWLGESPWSERMIGMMDDLSRYIEVADDPSYSVTVKTEVNGELLQVLSRVYWMTGNPKYLEWAIKIGDHFLLTDAHPLKSANVLRLRDHGCEMISGLCELYATLHFRDPEKKKAYREPLYSLLDHVLEHGRNADGFFYNAYNPQTTEALDGGISDSWGYNLNGYYTVYLVDGTERYRDPLLHLFAHLHNYRGFDWESGSADGYADAIESALNLYNRLPDPRVAEWIDSEIRIMWSMQDASPRDKAGKWAGSGIIEGWHGDGNFARTTIMYNLWKSQGTYTDHFVPGLKLGAEMRGDSLLVSLQAPDQDWTGRLYFDKARHRDQMKMPLDWPRINQFPEWFSVTAGKMYRIWDENGKHLSDLPGYKLLEGVPVKLKASEKKGVIVKEL